jgi:carbonic anhydrase
VPISFRPIRVIKEHYIQNVSKGIFMKTQNKASQDETTPELALQFLKEGNRRFLKDASIERDYHYQIAQTAGGQFPFAVILSCIDSRIPTEIIFDKGIGDLFNARIAGNIINEDILGSMEFACRVAGAKLILVLGHTSCGAVQGACDNTELGNLTGLLSRLKPAVETTPDTGGSDRSSANNEFVNAVALKNVELTIEQIKEKSPVLKEMLDKGEIGIAGAMYKIDSGRVEFMD